MMDEEDIIPVDQLAMDAATIVSETDASHSVMSSGDEGDIDNWLSTRHTRNHNLQMNKINEEDDDDDLDNTELMKEDAAGPSDLYDNNLDDEDEAWVYKNLRSGQEKTVYVQRKQTQGDDTTLDNSEKQIDNDTSDAPSAKKMRSSGEQDVQMGDNRKDNNEEDNPSANDKQPQDPCSNPQLQQALLLKPRTSDAILSCPRCFNIVCMDCQQHEKYAGQFRAMFVMNIGVDWNKKIIYDEQVGELKLAASSGGASRVENDTAMQEGDNSAVDGPDKIPHDNSSLEQNTTIKQENGELYYSVHCSYCQYEVAALDMKDEIYHFFGCLPSS